MKYIHLNIGVRQSSFEKETTLIWKTYSIILKSHNSLYDTFLKYINVFTCIPSIAFKSVWRSFQKVAFRTHNSPCEKSMALFSSCAKGNLFIYRYIAIPSKEGDVSVRKCRTGIVIWTKIKFLAESRTLFWKGILILNKQLLFKRPLYSLRTVRACLYASFLEKMQYCFFLWWRFLLGKKWPLQIR
jgi:hypothetical protein